jgi:radical SAM superfamily enzyme
VVSLPAIVATLGAAVALALLYRFGKKIFRVTIEYRGTYTPPKKRSVPRVGGVYFLTLTRDRAYVGQSNNIKRRFYEQLRKFSYDRPADIRSISVFHVAVSPGFDAPFRSVAECALHRNLTRQGVKVVNDTRYIPGC